MIIWPKAGMNTFGINSEIGPLPDIGTHIKQRMICHNLLNTVSRKKLVGQNVQGISVLCISISEWPAYLYVLRFRTIEALTPFPNRTGKIFTNVRKFKGTGTRDKSDLKLLWYDRPELELLPDISVHFYNYPFVAVQVQTLPYRPTQYRYR